MNRIGGAARPARPAGTLRTVLRRVSPLLILVAASGCVQEMANQPRYDTFQATTLYPDGTSARHPVEGTIARGQLQLDDAFFTGQVDGTFVTELPERVTEKKDMAQLLSRGQQRFDIFCSHCHGLVGGGSGGDEAMRELVGMVVKRGFPMPPTYHQARLRDAPLGHFFDVITRGFGRMPAHGYLIPPEDRWAIVAYIRALQLSQYADLSEMPPAVRQELEKAPSGS